MMRYKFVKEEFILFVDEAVEFLKDIGVWYLRGTARTPYFEKISKEYILANDFDTTALGIVTATTADAPMPWDILSDDQKELFVKEVHAKIPSSKELNIPTGVFEGFYNELTHDEETFKEIGPGFVFPVSAFVLRTVNNQSIYIIKNKEKGLEIILEEPMEYPENEMDKLLTRWMTS